MKKISAIALLFILAVATRMLAETVQRAPDIIAADAALALGFVLIFSYLVGQAVARFGVPTITGYLIVGVLFGPFLLSAISPALAVINPQTIKGLRLLDGAALGLIALTAGGELNMRLIRKRGKVIAAVVCSHLVIIMAGVSTAVYFLRRFAPGIADLSPTTSLAAALLLGVTAVAKSPATTIAVIQEYHSNGPMTQLVLGVTVAKDVVVVILFTIVLAIAIRLVGSSTLGTDINTWVLAAKLTWEVIGSLLLGVLVGWLIRLYGRRAGEELPLVVLAIAFLSGSLSEHVELSGLLVCMVAGFYVENFSTQGDALIDAVERNSAPLYVVFFTMAGAGIDLHLLAINWPLASGLVLLRLLFTFVASYVGARWACEGKAVCRYNWTGFIGQAGVTLGFAALIARRIQPFGAMLSHVIVAGVAINQLIGPIIFRLGLSRAHELPEHDTVTTITPPPAAPLRRLSTRELTSVTIDDVSNE